MHERSNFKNMNTVMLNNGLVMPQMGYGVYQIPPAECERCVLDAPAARHRLADTSKSLFFVRPSAVAAQMSMDRG